MTTLNNFDAYRGNVVHACQGETIRLAWDSYSDAVLELSAQPSNGVSPALTPRDAKPSGQLEVTALRHTTFKISSNDDSPGETVDLIILPDTFCTTFNFPLAGWYSGTLEQTAPVAVTLPRELRLYAFGHQPELALFVDSDTDFFFYEYSESPPLCRLEVSAATLRCEGKEGRSLQGTGDSSFTFEAQITERGLVGRYNGTSVNTTSTVPYKGTFDFEKQRGVPPQEELERGE